MKNISYKTALGIYMPFLKFLNLIGVYPYGFTNSNSVSISPVKIPKSESLAENHILIYFHTTGFNLWKHRLCLFGYALHAGFQTVQLYRHFFGHHEWDKSELATISTWWLHFSFSAYSIISLVKGKGKYLQFLKDWNQIEYQVLYEGWNDLDPEQLVRKYVKLDKSFKNQKLYFRIGMAFLPLSMLISMTSIYLSYAINPERPHYIASVLDPRNKALSLASIIYQEWALFFLNWSLAQFELLSLAFGQSVSKALKIIGRNSTPKTNHAQDEPIALIKHPKPKSTFQIDVCLAKYKKLKGLTQSFNEIFAWQFFFYKAFAISQICSAGFAILKKLPTSLGAKIAFVYTVVSFLARVSILLPVVGSIYRESELFKKTWIQSIPLLTSVSELQKKIKRQLKTCLAFGVRCGNFYLIEPKSLLILFSIMTTYITVLLQI